MVQKAVQTKAKVKVPGKVTKKAVSDNSGALFAGALWLGLAGWATYDLFLRPKPEVVAQSRRPMALSRPTLPGYQSLPAVQRVAPPAALPGGRAPGRSVERRGGSDRRQFFSVQ